MCGDWSWYKKAQGLELGVGGNGALALRKQKLWNKSLSSRGIQDIFAMVPQARSKWLGTALKEVDAAVGRRLELFSAAEQQGIESDGPLAKTFATTAWEELPAIQPSSAKRKRKHEADDPGVVKRSRHEGEKIDTANAHSLGWCEGVASAPHGKKCCVLPYVILDISLYIYVYISLYLSIPPYISLHLSVPPYISI